MKKYLIKNANMVNEGIIIPADILIEKGRIARIDTSITSITNAEVIDAQGSYVLPGVIDDQVHFREPGLTHKGDIATESAAAIAGGITTFFEQPNTLPQTTTIALLEEKMAIAQQSSFANYSFFLGGTNDNLEELKRLKKNTCAGVKLFLGSSTGNMLVDDEKTIENIFTNVDQIIATHCEDEATIRKNLQQMQNQYGEAIPIDQHPLIRSSQACYKSSSKAIELAQKTNARLHVFHISTAQETALFRNDIPLKDKKITAEVCLHHLWFSQEDYPQKGSYIKWNPAVKTQHDRHALWQALIDDRLDVIATDHAPHTQSEKKQTQYNKIPSGGPLVQHSLIAMLEKHNQGYISIEKIVQKMCHNPAILFAVENRGFLREGYHADIVIVNPNKPWTVNKENIRYKCGWSPFENETFSWQVTHTFVNGYLAYTKGTIQTQPQGQRVQFNR